MVVLEEIDRLEDCTDVPPASARRSDRQNDSEWRGAGLLVAASHLMLLALVIVDSLQFAPHADNLWQLNLVRQLRLNGRSAAVLVDANRIFPDLLVASGLDQLWNAFGAQISGSAYVRCVATVNVVLLYLLSTAVRRRFGASASVLASGLILLLFGTNEYFLELIRPGFHTTASLLILIWLLLRFVPQERLNAGDVAFLAAVCISSRIFVVLILVPCLVAQFGGAERTARIRRCVPLLAATVLATVGWLGLRLVPNLYFVAFDSTPHLEALPSLPLDFASNAQGRHYLGQMTAMWIRLTPVYSVVALVALVCGAMVAFRLRSSGNRQGAILGAVSVVSLVVGSAAMRLVNYVVTFRMYVLLLPILLATVFVAVAAHRWLIGQAGRWTVVAPVVVTGLALVLTFANTVAVARSGQHDRYQTVAGLLRSQDLIDVPGLATYWPGYELAVANQGIDARLIGDDALPLFWVNNPWDLFRVPDSSQVDMGVKLHWVLAFRESAGSVDSKSIPSAADVAKVFGLPTRTVVGVPRASEQVPVLFVYEDGVDLDRVTTSWRGGMSARGLRLR